MNKKLVLALICAMALIAVVQSADPTPIAAPTTAESKLCGVDSTKSGRGYVWVTDVCLPCANGCAKCTKAGGCDACIDTWVFNDSTKKEYCWNPLLDNAGALLAAGTHTNCAQNCADLTGKTAGCTKCNAGYGLKANKCEACPANCDKCKFDSPTATTGTCDQCKLAYYLAAGKCEACTVIENCAQCDSTGKACATCNSGFHLQSGKCVKCDTPAVECDASSKPTKCAPAYFLDKTDAANPKCTACSTGCVRCTSATACEECVWHGYALVSGACKACPTGARFCTSDTVALVCEPGKAVVSGACVTAIDNCAQHTSATVCAKCLDGYYFHSDKCVYAAGNSDLQYCTTITQATAAATPAKCTACKTLTAAVSNVWKYVVSAKTNYCEACPAYCKDCTIAADGTPTCTTCDTGYVKASDNKSCQPCTGIDTAKAVCKGVATANGALGACYAMDGTTKCAPNTTTGAIVPDGACLAGYYGKTNAASSEVECIACGTGIKTCNAKTANNALTCNDGYYYTSTSGSEACDPCAKAGCKDCAADKAKCKACFDGNHYTTIDATDGTCAACTTTAVATCSTQKCPSDKATVGTNCVAKANIVNGETRDATLNTVTGCPSDYWLQAADATQQGQCHKCSDAAPGPAIADCKQCTAGAGSKCTLCSTATNTLQGTTPACTADANCGLISASKCLWCKVGYNVGSTGACAACTGACTFSCNLPSLAPPAGAGGAGAGGAAASSNGALLTFAFTALLALLALLF